MAWLSSNSFTAGMAMSHAYLNNLANDIRAWGGNVNAGGYTLSNVPSISLGTGTAAQKLAVYESGANFYGLGMETGAFGAAMRHVAGTTGGHSFFVDNTIRAAFIASSGRVQIGTGTDPQTPLHVTGNVSNEIARFQGGGLTANRAFLSLYNNNSAFWFEMANGDPAGGGTLNGFGFWDRNGSGSSVLRMYLHGGGGASIYGLPSHADNAAATGAGLTAGRLYRTATGVMGVVF